MTVWSNEFDPPNPPLHHQLIVDAQALLGVQLPTSYLDILAEQNGGYVDDQLVAVPVDPVPETLRPFVSDGYVTVGSIAGIGDADDIGSIRRTPYLLREWSLPDRLVLLDGDGHSWIALDYRITNDDPPVVFIESDGGTHLGLARNFAGLLASFLPHDSVYDEDGQLRSQR